MKNYFEKDPWKIIEKGFDPQFNKAAESICSIGNGRMGQRANFEELYSGDKLQGSYLAGIYYPDKTRVGWWKVGYPEYFAKVINSVNWIGIRWVINGEELDLKNCDVSDFVRELDMKRGLLTRSFIAKLPGGEKVKVRTRRFYSMTHKDLGLIDYSLEPLNFSGKITIIPYLDFDIYNEDSNYGEQFWEGTDRRADIDRPFVQAKTKKLDFEARATMACRVFAGGEKITESFSPADKESYVEHSLEVDAKQGQVLSIHKHVCIVSNYYHDTGDFEKVSHEQLDKSLELGFEKMLEKHCMVWEEKWKKHDIVIEGDVAAQQGIRFNIFHLNQTYTGEDPRLNIGPKGFTGEKYGGSTYWDTEAYCLPFYLSSADKNVARNLLKYRFNHLGKAIENAEKLGFSSWAALYPMVTMNGEECHNEWEITFEEIHRNAAIAYAIFDYTRYTGDEDYIVEYGLEVLIAICRFWAQRVNFSKPKQKYVILGVTGPNEYENNINNNWYTNYAAVWCLRYTLENLEKLKKEDHSAFSRLAKKTSFDEKKETEKWRDIVENMFFPTDSERDIFLQQEGFLDKEIKPADQLPADQLPLNQNWSWDRILRSCYIKQADVLQGLYFFEHEFSKEEVERNFDYYEPITVHESSLSPCVHVIHAARLNKMKRAYELYLRTSRLDLDDYNKEVDEGLHITSMGGTWMSVVKGFGGMRVADGELHFNPKLPDHWTACKFTVMFRGSLIRVSVFRHHTEIKIIDGSTTTLRLFGQKVVLQPNQQFETNNPGR